MMERASMGEMSVSEEKHNKAFLLLIFIIFDIIRKLTMHCIPPLFHCKHGQKPNSKCHFHPATISLSGSYITSTSTSVPTTHHTRTYLRRHTRTHIIFSFYLREGGGKILLGLLFDAAIFFPGVRAVKKYRKKKAE